MTESYSTAHLFSLNVMLMLAWSALTGTFSALNLFTGFALGWVVLWFIQPLYGHGNKYFWQPWRVSALIIVFLAELILSSFRVAWEVLAIKFFIKPGIVGVPLSVKTDMQILLLANFISLTPGSLTLDISEDRKTLYLHTMFASDPDKVRADIKNGIEKRILEIMG
jgi:multicomponent Na+:H+ antiporter subunit E